MHNAMHAANAMHTPHANPNANPNANAMHAANANATTAFDAVVNVKPSVWGGPSWRFLHAVTLAYPVHPEESHKSAARALFGSLTTLLPCENCRVNLVTELEALPLTEVVLRTKGALVEWFLELHNSVNVRLGKPRIPLDGLLAYLVAPHASPTAPVPPSGRLNGMQRVATEECKSYHGAFVGTLVALLLLMTVGVVLAVVSKRRSRGPKTPRILSRPY
jgi:hypothetical protein